MVLLHIYGRHKLETDVWEIDSISIEHKNGAYEISAHAENGERFVVCGDEQDLIKFFLQRNLKIRVSGPKGTDNDRQAQ